MKNHLLHSLLTAAIALMGWNQTSNAQTLFKDLEAGVGVSSNPQQFTNVNGTVYFLTDPSVSRRHALWKTDGTVGNTVMVKDSIITTNVSDRFMIQGHSGDTLYYTVNQNVQTDTTTELWMVINGSSPQMVCTLVSTNVNSFSNGEPRLYTMAGGKLYFQMYTSHGYELWVSNGTQAGTSEVVDLFPGSTSGIANGGANPVPMVEYNGKVYFQGITSFNGSQGLYSSDGTSAGTTLLKSGSNLDPQFFTVYNNELYFQTNSGLWKTDGTINGTVSVSNTGFNSDARVFKNEMFYNVGSTMYKSDGTTNGTVSFMDSVGVILGMNNDYFLSRYMRTFATPPYYEYYYWRSDGSVAGTTRVSDTLANAASFVVLNNKMYSAGTGTALWESDGTVAGTTNLVTGIVSYPFVLNNTVFFSNWGTGATTGYELWSYTPAGTIGIAESQADQQQLGIYPNPSNGHFRLNTNLTLAKNASLEMYNALGERVYRQATIDQQNEIAVSHLSNGIYFVKVMNGTEIYYQKIMMQQ